MTDRAEYLTIIKRETDPPEVLEHRDLPAAADYFDRAGAQWSESFLVQVVAGPGKPLAMTGNPIEPKPDMKDTKGETSFDWRAALDTCLPYGWTKLAKTRSAAEALKTYIEELERKAERFDGTLERVKEDVAKAATRKREARVIRYGSMGRLALCVRSYDAAWLEELASEAWKPLRLVLRCGDWSPSSLEPIPACEIVRAQRERLEEGPLVISEDAPGDWGMDVTTIGFYVLANGAEWEVQMIKEWTVAAHRSAVEYVHHLPTVRTP